MIKAARAVAFAAAAFLATVALVDGAPLQAEQGEAQAPSAHFLDHAAADAGLAGDLGVNAPPVVAAAAPINRFAALPTMVRTFVADRLAPQPAVIATPAPLLRLVSDEARFETANAEQDCLANAVYFEARGESLEGQLAVAEVVLNRARSGRYPTTLCAVVTQPAQFSFVRRGVIPAADRACEAWRRAVAIARIAQAGERRQLSRDVLWYHANYVSPSWGRRLVRSARIGLHIFYS